MRSGQALCLFRWDPYSGSHIGDRSPREFVVDLCTARALYYGNFVPVYTAGYEEPIRKALAVLIWLSLLINTIGRSQEKKSVFRSF